MKNILLIFLILFITSSCDHNYKDKYDRYIFKIDKVRKQNDLRPIIKEQIRIREDLSGDKSYRDKDSIRKEVDQTKKSIEKIINTATYIIN